MRRNIAVGGTLAAVAAVAAGLAVALAGGQTPDVPRDTPAGQVEVLSDEPTPEPNTTTPPAAPSTQDTPAVPAPAPQQPQEDTGGVTQPPTVNDPPEVAPGNPVGDVEPRPAPAPAPVPVPQPTEEPTEVNQPPTNQPADPSAG